MLLLPLKNVVRQLLARVERNILGRGRRDPVLHIHQLVSLSYNGRHNLVRRILADSRRVARLSIRSLEGFGLPGDCRVVIPREILDQRRPRV